MTRDEWMTSITCYEMFLRFQTRSMRKVLSLRKLRLFAVASARVCEASRKSWDALSWRVIDACEALADTPDEDRAAWSAIHKERSEFVMCTRTASVDATYAATSWMTYGVQNVSDRKLADQLYRAAKIQHAKMAGLFRDIWPFDLEFSNRKRKVVCPDCMGSPFLGQRPKKRGKCLRCKDAGTLRVKKEWIVPAAENLAGLSYLERDPVTGFMDHTTLLALADMLEEKGCDDSEVIDHLRGEPCSSCEIYLDPADCICKGTRRIPSGPHVRGCWVIDMLTGRR
jgi:hypothetical protein